jgi:hypothetical protein
MLISKPKAFRFDGAIFSGTISGTIVVVTDVVGTVVVGSVSAALSSLGPDEFRTERPVRHQARPGNLTAAEHSVAGRHRGRHRERHLLAKLPAFECCVRPLLANHCVIRIV